MSSASTRSSESKQASMTPSSKDQPSRQGNDVREDFQTLIEDVASSVHDYCKKRPQMAGLMIFAMGFYVGWKIKPW